MTANPLPNPGFAQSSVTFGLLPEYSFSFANCQPNNAVMNTAKNAHVNRARVGRLRKGRSKNHPQKILATVATTPEVNEPRVLARTEKYLVKYMPRYVPFQLKPVRMGMRRYICFFFNKFHSLRNSASTALFCVGSGIFLPSRRMIFSGDEMSNASGKPRHWRPINTRYVVYETLPRLPLFTFKDNWIDAPISWPSSRSPSQIPAVTFGQPSDFDGHVSNLLNFPRSFTSPYPSAMAPSEAQSADAAMPQVAPPKRTNHSTPYRLLT